MESNFLIYINVFHEYRVWKLVVVHFEWRAGTVLRPVWEDILKDKKQKQKRKK